MKAVILNLSPLNQLLLINIVLVYNTDKFIKKENNRLYLKNTKKGGRNVKEIEKLF